MSREECWRGGGNNLLRLYCPAWNEVTHGGQTQWSNCATQQSKKKNKLEGVYWRVSHRNQTKFGLHFGTFKLQNPPCSCKLQLLQHLKYLHSYLGGGKVQLSGFFCEKLCSVNSPKLPQDSPDRLLKCRQQAARRNRAAPTWGEIWEGSVKAGNSDSYFKHLIKKKKNPEYGTILLKSILYQRWADTHHFLVLLFKGGKGWEDFQTGWISQCDLNEISVREVLSEGDGATFI